MRETVRPAKLGIGSTVAVTAPGGPPSPEKLAEGLEVLRSHGFSVIVGETATMRRGYLAGDDALRAAELESFLRDGGIDAVFCARGGYGSFRLLDLIDFTTLRNRPPVFMGYSDITCLLMALYQRAGWVCFHGPMVGVDLTTKSRTTAEDTTLFWHDLLGGSPLTGFRLDGEPLIGGTGAGRLIGGNLTILQTLIGTDFLVDSRDHVLFIEEINEEPYRIDRMLMHLKLAGVFRGLAGVLIGSLTDCLPGDDEPSLSYREILDDVFGDCGFPVIGGLPFGHGPRDTMVMPLGVPVSLDGNAGTVTFLDEAIERCNS